MARGSECCSTDVKTVLACGGASNVGQITNEVAKRLDTDGLAKFFCVAGVGARISGMVESVRSANKVLVLDGCTVVCAKKCMDQAGLTNYEHLVVTDLSIAKVHAFDLAPADLEKTYAAACGKLGVAPTR
jgi:uncharacterized metal-binding protein